MHLSLILWPLLQEQLERLEFVPHTLDLIQFISPYDYHHTRIALSEELDPIRDVGLAAPFA